jgi:hypothetical protein
MRSKARRVGRVEAGAVVAKSPLLVRVWWMLFALAWTAVAAWTAGLAVVMGGDQIWEDMGQLLSALVRRPVMDVVVLIMTIAWHVIALGVVAAMFIIFAWSGLKWIRFQIGMQGRVKDE